MGLSLWRLGWLVVSLFSMLQLPAPQPYQTSDTPRLQEIAHWGGSIRATLLDNTILWVAEDEALVRMSVVGEQALTPIDYIPLNRGYILALARTTQHLYALTETHIIVINLTDNQIVQQVGGGGTALTIQGTILAVTRGEQGTRLYTIASDGTLTATHTVSTDDTSHASHITARNLLVTAEGHAGLTLYGLDPTAPPQALANLTGIVPTEQVTSFDTWLYATADHNLHIVNAADPRNPTVASIYSPLNNIQNMAWVDNYLVVADGGDGIKVYAADWREGLRYRGAKRGLNATLVRHDPNRNLLYIGTPTAFYIYDASQLPNLVLLGEMSLWSPPTNIVPLAESDWLLLSLGTGGLAIIDISLYFSPQLTAVLPFSGPVMDVAQHPNLADTLYLSLGDGRLLTLAFDRASPNNSLILSDISVAGQPAELAISPSGDFLALTSGRAGVYFYRLAGVTPIELFTLPAYSLTGRGATQIRATSNGNWLIADSDRLRYVRLQGTQSAQVLSDMPLSVGGTISLTAQGVIWGEGHEIRGIAISGNRLVERLTYQAPTHYHALQALVGQVILLADNSLILLDVSNPYTPIEQQNIPLPSSADAMHINGDDIFLSSVATGVIHWRMSLPSAFVGTIAPQLSSRYEPLHDVTQLLPLNGEAWGLMGKRWDTLHLEDGVRLLTDYPTHAGVSLGNGHVVLLDADYHPYLVDADGQHLAENTDVAGAAVAWDGAVLWLAEHDGTIRALDAQTLDPLPRSVKLDMLPTAMRSLNGQLLIGTQDGALWWLNPPLMERAIADDVVITQLPALGDAIANITPIPQLDSHILVSAGTGGLWWLMADDSRFQVILHQDTPSYSASLSADTQWLTVARGACGLEVWDARQRDLGLRFYGSVPQHIVEDVAFVGNDRLLAVSDGLPKIYRFTIDGYVTPPPSPVQPYPPDQATLSAPFNELRWYVPHTACAGYTFEVWIDGVMVGTTTELVWRFDAPRRYDLTWQVVAIDQLGQRTPSPMWQVFAPIEGLIAQPISLENRLSTQEETAANAWQWGLLIGGLVMLILLGGIIFGRRLTPRRRF